MLGNDTVLCEGQEITLKNNVEEGLYLWNTGSTEASISVNKTGKYWLYTVAGNCVFNDSINITFLPLPQVNLGLDTFLCEGEERELNAANTGANYFWSTGETSQKIKVRQPGNYIVKVTAGQCFVIDTITMLTCPPVLYIPTAFSPNDDNINDRFQVFEKDVATGSLMIFNRWGECVFETKNLNESWDGKFKNTLCSEDAYIWILRYQSNLAPKADYRELRGVVNLLR